MSLLPFVAQLPDSPSQELQAWTYIHVPHSQLADTWFRNSCLAWSPSAERLKHQVARWAGQWAMLAFVDQFHALSRDPDAYLLCVQV